MAEDKNTLQLISDITEFNDLHEYMQDEHLDKALAIVVKLLMTPDVPSAKAPTLIMELQAMSTKFAVMSSVYSTIAKDKAGTVNNNKKEVHGTTPMYAVPKRSAGSQATKNMPTGDSKSHRVLVSWVKAKDWIGQANGTRLDRG